jgi:CheY-like chemotaxis protein
LEPSPGGVVHDFNNLLAAIHAASELADLRLPAEHPARRPLEVIRKSVYRGRELNQQILGFTRMDEKKQVPFDLAAVVREVCDLLTATIPKAVTVRCLAAEGAWMRGDPGRLYQVVLNLALNACHAMKEKGGVLELALQAVPPATEAAGADPGSRADRQAVLTVSDTGCGMAPDAVTRVFDPFFTTKPEGEGTGLGLFVVQGIVRQHRGRIQIKSDPGLGTTFEVTLPLAPAPVEAPLSPSAETLGGDERILLVEPDDLLLALAKQGLQELGYRVTGRSSAAEAMDALLSTSLGHDLLLTTHHPPTLDGTTLLRQARALHPGLLGILVMDPMGSFGASFDTLEDSDEIVTRLSAPKDLARAIRMAVETRSAPGIPLAAAERIPRVLIVEGSPTDRRFMAFVLANAGYAVEEAEDGQAAWDLILSKETTDPFDVVITDLAMPRMDGFELAGRVKAWDPRVPLVVVTSRSDGEAFRRAMGLGAADFLLKPVDSDQLIECVDRLRPARFPDAS